MTDDNNDVDNNGDKDDDADGDKERNDRWIYFQEEVNRFTNQATDLTGNSREEGR